MGLGVLEYYLHGLEVDDRLLNAMKKWDCLTQKHVDDVGEKPREERLKSMIDCLEKRGPNKWPLLVCVLLEIGHDKMAEDVCRAVLKHLKRLQAGANEPKR